MRAPRRKRAIPAVACLVALLIGAPPIGRAEAEDPAQAGAAHKAAYLRHIADLTTWPEGTFVHAEAPIVIGVLGEDASGVADALERRIRGKGLSAQKRRVELRYLEPDDTLAVQLDGCHLLFLPVAHGSQWPRLREVLADRSIVTVSDVVGFSRADGMIEFVFDRAESNVSLHIDLVSVRRAGLRLSSRLLGLKRGVKIVRSPGEGGA